MNTYWQEWFAKTMISPDGDLMALRQQGIERFAKSVAKTKNSATDIMTLCRLAFSLPEATADKSNTTIKRMRAVFAKVDPDFEMQSNALEMRILAGAVLEYLLTADQINAEISDVAALAVKCSPEIDRAKDKVGRMLSDLLNSATIYISTEAEKRRELISSELVIEPISSKVPDTLKKIDFEQISGEALHIKTLRTLTDQISILVEEVSQFANRASVAQEKISHNQEIYGEDSDVLWWLFSRHSRDLEKPYNEIDLALACLVAAKELADITVIDLEHPYATEFLTSMIEESHGNATKGDDTEEIEVRHAINQIPQDWGLNWVETMGENIKSSAVGSLCPISQGIDFSLQTEEDDWLELWTKATGLPDNYSLNPKALSQQLYNECLLLKICRTL